MRNIFENFLFCVQDIPTEFDDLCLEWQPFNCINVYSTIEDGVEACWRLLIRRREDHWCSTIEDGWQRFRDDLGLKIGHVCVFQCPSKSYDHFRIRVWRNDDEY